MSFVVFEYLSRSTSETQLERIADFSCRFASVFQARKTIKAQKLWFAILESQVETGTPYMLYKDACNSKSNQQNLGCIKVTPPPHSS